MINVFNESGDSTINIDEQAIKKLGNIAREEGLKEDEINIVLCTDEFLLEMNKTYLRHDYYTDVITFDQSEGDEEISGDVYISPDQVRRNAEEYGVGFDTELLRVMIHGVLHLVGYDDRSDEERAQMRKKENHYMGL